MNTSVTIGNLVLKSPVIVSSCSLTTNPANCCAYEKAGAGAVVLKSIFQEEILANFEAMDTSFHTEALDYLGAYHEQACVQHYCNLINEIKKVCTLPVIASINCSSASGWTSYAKSFQDAGAAAIELNVMHLESSTSYEYGNLERQHIAILKAVKEVVSIPIIMKIGRAFTNAVQLVSSLYAAGAAAVVLFNKMCPVDIDIDSIGYKMGNALSSHSDLYDVMRWTALASAQVPSASILASGGVSNGQALVKVLLSGAKAAEVCSILYSMGPAAISEMMTTLNSWMEKHNFSSIDEFCGSMNASKHEGAAQFERIQFIRNFSKAKSL